MISKCYLYLKDYKNAINNINGALSSYFALSKTFKDYHSRNYNPKIMLFIETNIFQNILFIISNICTTFRKPYASNWINFNIFHTSPFILSNIHYSVGINLFYFLDKNKNRIKRLDKNLLRNVNSMKEYDNIKKYYLKNISRLSSKIKKSKNKTNLKRRRK